jgi:sugar lactone lactonase YvrE
LISKTRRRLLLLALVCLATAGVVSAVVASAANPTCPGAAECPWDSVEAYPADVSGLRDASDVAVDPSDGDIYVVEKDKNRVVRFEDGDDSQPAKRQVWGGPDASNGFAEFEMPSGVAVDSAGNVWVAEMNGNRVQKFDEDGDLLMVLGGTQGSADGQFTSPRDVAIDSAGNVYVADWGNQRIQKFNSEGVFQAKTGPGAFDTFDGPIGIATDGSHVWSVTNDRIKRYVTVDLTTSVSENGESLNSSGFTSIGVLGGVLYVADSAGKIHAYSGGAWDTHDLGGNNSLTGVDVAAVGGTDYVFVSDQLNPQVHRFTTDFSAQQDIAAPETDQMFAATAVAVDPDGDVWGLEGQGSNIGDNYHRLFRFNSDGSLQQRFGANGADGSTGSDPGEFNFPSDVVADGSNIFVADTFNHVIQKYDGTNWTELDMTGGPQDPAGMTLAGSDLYVVEPIYGDSEVFKYSGGTWTGLGLSSVTGTQVEQVDGDFAQDVAVDGDGNVYVAVGNFDSSRIVKRAASDGSWSVIATHGNADGQVNYPRGIAYANNHLFVSDTNNNRIQKLTTAGAFVSAWGDGPDDRCAGEVAYPEGIAVSPDGSNVWVASPNGAGITRFTFDGTADVPTCDKDAPSGLTIDSPANAATNVSSTPSFAGGKGDAADDSDTVTLRVLKRATGSAALQVVKTLSATADGADWAINWTGDALADGEYWARVTQKDTAGNTRHAGGVGFDEWGSRRFTVGAGSEVTPTPTLDGISATKDTTPNFTGTATNQAHDSNSIEIEVYAGDSVSGSPVRTFTTPRVGTNWALANAAWATPLADGVYTARASQTNGSLSAPDNEGFTQARTFEIDTTAPVVNLADPADNSYTSSTRPAISGTAGNKTGRSADTELTFQLQKLTSGGYVPVNQGSISGGFFSVPKPTSSSSFSTTTPETLSDGTYHLRAYQDDAAGNSNPQDPRSSRLFTVDTQAPVIALSEPADNSSTTNSHPAISGTAGNAPNDGKLRFELNRWTGSAWVNHHSWEEARPTSSTAFSTSVPVSLSPGTYHLRMYQADSLGHEASQGTNSSRQFTVAPMFNPPVVRVTQPTHLYTTNSKYPFVAGTSDTPGRVMIELQRWTGSTWTVASTFYTDVEGGYFSAAGPTPLPDGTYNIFVYQTNLGGQTSNSSGVWYTIDTTAPAKPTIANPRNNTKISDQQPTFSGKADPGGAGQVHLELQGYAGNKWVVLKQHTVNRNGDSWSFKPSDYRLNSGYFALFAYQYDGARNVAISEASQFQVDTNGKAPDNPGTDNNACQKKLDWGPFHVEGSCLKREGLTWVSTAKLTFNGLQLQPDGGNAKVILDPFNLRIAAQGNVKVVLGPAHFCLEDPTRIISDTCFYDYKAGPFTIYEGSFDWSWQGKVQLPDLPKFGLPTGRAANLPQLPGLSGFNLPNLNIPGWGSVALPDFSKIKGPDIGKLSLPSLNAPGVQLPDNYFGNFKFDLPRLSIGTSGAGNLLGFPFEGRVGLRFADQGIYIDAGLKLPSILGGVTGDAELFVGNAGNILAKNLKFHASNFPMGPIGFRDLNISYSAANQLWEGSSWIDLPIPPTGLAVKAGAGFKNGQLVNAEAGFNQNFPIGTTGLFLYGGSIYFKTVPSRQVGGEINLGLGPSIKGVSAVRVDSGFKYQFADPGWQSYFRIDGGVKVVNIPLASAWIQIYEGGDIDFGGRIGKDFGGGFVVEATVDGWIQKKSKFNVDGKGKVHLGDWIKLDGNVNVSHIGVGGCATADGWFGKKTFGATYKWSGTLNTMWDNCSVGAVKAKKSSARVAGASQTVTVPGGEDAYVMGFKGQGGAPDVTLVGPKGERITTTGQSGLVGKQFLVIHVPEQNTTQVAIARPSAGRWTVEVADGSVPLTEVLTAETLDDPKIKASVGGKGGTRTLSYDIDAAPGDRISFVEIGPGGAQSPIGEVREGTGKLRFMPIAGPAGKRTIKAIVTKDGVARYTLERAATFRASKPGLLSAPKTVRVKRKKGKQSDALKVSWSKVTGATGYRVTAVVSGRKKVIETRKTRLTVAGLFARSKGTASVQTLNALGEPGKARKATAKPPKPKHPPKKKKKKKKKGKKS